MSIDDMSYKSMGWRFLIIAAAFVVVVAGMKAAEPLIVPFLLAAFVAIVCTPPLFWLQRKGIPQVMALVIVVMSVMCLGLLVVALIGTSLKDFSSNLPFYQERLTEKTSELVAWVSGFGINLSDKNLLEYVNPGAAMGFASTMFSGLGGVLSNSFLIMLTVIFILFEASSFPGKLRTALGDPDASLKNFELFLSNVNQYMAIKTWISLLTGFLITVWLLILGVDFPLLWGLLAFLLNFVPNIGSIIAAVPAFLLAFVQLGTGSALLTGLGYVVANVVVGNVIEPRFMGRGLGLSTLVVFVSLVFWGWVLGPVGMLLSVPLTMTVKIALDSYEDTRWIAILLGSDS